MGITFLSGNNHRHNRNGVHNRARGGSTVTRALLLLCFLSQPCTNPGFTQGPTNSNTNPPGTSGGQGAVSNPAGVAPQAPAGVIGTPSSSTTSGPKAGRPSTVPQTLPGSPNPVNVDSDTGLSPFFPPIPAPGPAQMLPGPGEAASPSDLPSSQLTQDYDVINAQAQEFRQRYLNTDLIELALPKPNQLMPLSNMLPPIRLEANYTEPVSLKAVVNYAIDHNLAIGIANATRAQQFWLTVSNFGGFLPNIIMNYQHQILSGQSLVGGVIPTTFHTPNTTAQAGLQYYGFQGGSVLFSALSQMHTYKASKAALKGTINDTLLAVANGYYTLVQNQALLQIQTRAVDVSRAQVTLNRQLEAAGTGTKFQVLQAETQLARDEQALLTQEVALRNSAINLATILNLQQAVNFLSVEALVRKVRLIDPNMDINRLIAIAILHRPELSRFEELRIAARRQIQVAAAPLYPQFQFFANVLGNGATLGNSTVFQPGQFVPVPLDQVATAQPLNTAAFGVTPSGQGINASNAAGPAATSSGVAGAKSNSPIYLAGMQFVPGKFNNRNMKRSYSMGIRLDWNYPSLGVPSAANVQAARANARVALLQSNQQLMTVLQQVRTSYLNSQTAERQIEVTDKEVTSSAEELRLARVRLANGVGTNIDVINAQRDFTTALVDKANAIISFNIAQVQLLHDIGVISTDTLTSGRLVKE